MTTRMALVADTTTAMTMLAIPFRIIIIVPVPGMRNSSMTMAMTMSDVRNMTIVTIMPITTGMNMAVAAGMTMRRRNRWISQPWAKRLIPVPFIGL